MDKHRIEEFLHFFHKNSGKIFRLLGLNTKIFLLFLTFYDKLCDENKRIQRIIRYL